MGLSTKKEKAIMDIKKNYRQIEQSIVNQLYMKQRLHPYTAGAEREDVWEQLFRMILPKKFVLEHSVFIIDSYDGVSNEVDLAVIDETYTPYIFHYGRLKFIPIEAVAAVVECKSGTVEPDSIKKWADSITQLKTYGESIARMATQIATEYVPTQQSTRPLRILCCMKGSIKEETGNLFDFILNAVKEQKDKPDGSLIPAHIEVKVNPKNKSLKDWYADLDFKSKEDYMDAEKKIFNTGHLNKELAEKGRLQKEKLENTSLSHYEITDKEGCKQGILSFHFQINQLLMLINNPLLFPHQAYVDMFNRIKEEAE